MTLSLCTFCHKNSSGNFGVVFCEDRYDGFFGCQPTVSPSLSAIPSDLHATWRLFRAAFYSKFLVAKVHAVFMFLMQARGCPCLQSPGNRICSLRPLVCVRTNFHSTQQVLCALGNLFWSHEQRERRIGCRVSSKDNF